MSGKCLYALLGAIVVKHTPRNLFSRHRYALGHGEVLIAQFNRFMINDRVARNPEVGFPIVDHPLTSRLNAA